jgi:hypothetical protein
MRTTLALDDDVLYAVKELARRQGRTAGEVLSDLARSALTQRSEDSQRAPAGQGRFGFRPLARRGGTVSNALIDSLREDEGV